MIFSLLIEKSCGFLKIISDFRQKITKLTEIQPQSWANRPQRLKKISRARGAELLLSGTLQQEKKAVHELCRLF
jgi:hypothetical protein